jgi:serine protease Do
MFGEQCPHTSRGTWRVGATLDVIGRYKENVNFAIKSSIVTNFLDTNGASYIQGATMQPMQPADLADQAKAMSVFIECE